MLRYPGFEGVTLAGMNQCFMKIISILSLCILLSATCYGRTIRRVLFLGNSYTYVNNMPQLVANMASAMGDSLIFDSYTPGGYTLDQHGQDPIALGKIMLGNWDYLVLQEQSQLPGDPGYFSNELWGLCELFRAHNPCGRLMYYMTWGRKNGDATNCANFPNMCTYIGMDTTIRQNYINMAVNTRGDVSPVGATWRYIRQHSPTIELYQTDESHPSEAGSYLAACSFYTTIFKRNPALINYNYVLAASVANTIKQAAKLVAFDSLSYWQHSLTTLTANFYYTIGNGTNVVNFINTSSIINTLPVADSYLWDFGDGFTSTQKYPSHSYANNGTYTVTLTSYNCDIDTTYQSSHQATVSFCAYTPTISPTNIILCPGIIDTLWTQVYDTYQWYDEIGNPIPNATNRYYVCTGGNHYSVKVSQNGCSEISVPVFVDIHSIFSTQFHVVNDSGTFVEQDTACIGSNVTLSLWYNKPPFPDDRLIDWTFNGQPIVGYHNDTLVINTSGIYTVTLHHEFCPNFDRTQQVQYTFIDCTTGITPINETPFTVYPNPGTGIFNLECRRAMKVTVYDVYGKMVWTQNVNTGKQPIDLNDQPAGIYFVHAYSDGRGYNLKLIKR